MAEVQPFQPVLPFVGVLYIEKTFCDRALNLVEGILGTLELKSEPIPFEYTHYYEAEMGAPITRVWAGSTELADPSELADWKLATDKIERELAVDDCRTVNLDPGFVGLSKAVLASLKDHPQRVPLKDGVYAEIELTFSDDNWRNVPWTYRDYADKPAKDFLMLLRERLLIELRKKSLL